MTKQIESYLKAEGQHYTVCRFTGENKFNHETLGIDVDCGSTDCYDGWHATWILQQGRLFIDSLTVLASRPPTICGINPIVGDFISTYESLLLPWGFSGELTLIPSTDEDRAWRLHFAIPDKDEIVPQFTLIFDLGRLRSTRNDSYLIEANMNEDAPGKRARAGRIFGEVPTPFDHLAFSFDR